jgi:Cd2+/Zn2+-exporting ATPase
MIVVAAGAWIVGAQAEGALLLFLFSTAGAIEHYAMDRTRGPSTPSSTSRRSTPGD